MNLTSCDGCGVVLDKNRLYFPDEIYTEEGVDESKGMYNGREYVPFVECPVCDHKIPEREGW